MSGPKSGTWCVARPGEAGISFEEAKALLRYYLDCIMQFQKQLELLLRRRPDVTINTELDDIPAPYPGWAQQISRELNTRYEIYIRLRDEVEAAKAELAMRERAAGLVATLQRCRPAVQHAEKPRQDLNRIVQEVLANLDADTPAASQAELDALVASCLATEEMGRAELLLTELRVKVSQLNKTIRMARRRRAEQRDREAFEARECLQQIGALKDSGKDSGKFAEMGSDKNAGSDDLRHELMRVACGDVPFTDDLRRRVAAAQAEAEKQQAGRVLREVLGKLGYEVQNGFDTLFEQGGANFFQRSSWGEYHCRLTVDARRQHLNFDMVRYGAENTASMDTTLRDREMEQKWCQEVPQLLSQLADAGMAVNLTRKLAPGKVVLQVIDDNRLKPQQQTRRRDTSQSRELLRERKL